MTIELTCSGCENTWTGTGRCHCSGCHFTFGGLVSFSEHRYGSFEGKRKCKHPSKIGLIETEKGIWSAEYKA